MAGTLLPEAHQSDPIAWRPREKDARRDRFASAKSWLLHSSQAKPAQEAEQAAEGPDRPLLLRRQARGKDPGGIGPSDHDLGVRHAVGLDELIEDGGVGQRETYAAMRHRRTEAGMVRAMNDGPSHKCCAPLW